MEIKVSEAQDHNFDWHYCICNVKVYTGFDGFIREVYNHGNKHNCFQYRGGVYISREQEATMIELKNDETLKVVDGNFEKVDLVNHPPHYTKGSIEVIDFIEDQELGFNLGNTVKYICRSEHKGNKLLDLAKAKWYLEREISNLKKNGAL